MTTAIYRRVSRDAQDTKSQSRDIFAWLAANGMTRHDALWFTDRGVSSAKLSRPAFDEMMQAVEAGIVKRIVCWKIDRLNRWGPREHLYWRLGLARKGVEVLSLTETSMWAQDETMGILDEVLKARGRADWLRDHGQRIRAGIRAKRKPGSPWGGGKVVRGSLKPDGTPRRSGRALTPEQEAELDRAILAGERTAVLAEQFGVSPATISRRRRALAQTAA